MIKRSEPLLCAILKRLQTTLAKGNGEYLSALYSMLGVPEAEHSLMLKKLTVMAAENKEAPPFARAVLEKYGPDAGGVSTP
jgi:hypothetical protein